MRSLSNFMLAFMLGVATLAACEKITSTPVPVPTIPAAASVGPHADPVPTAAAQPASVATPAAVLPQLRHAAHVPAAKAAGLAALASEAAAYRVAYTNAATANRLLGEVRYRTSPS